MANREKGEFSVTAGSKVLTLRVGTNGIAEVEDLTGGRPWEAIWKGVLSGSVRDLRLFLWTALREHHSDIATTAPDSLKAVGRLIDDMGGIDGLWQQLQAFVKLNAEPETEKKGGKGSRPQKARRGAGAVSTRTASPSV